MRMLTHLIGLLGMVILFLLTGAWVNAADVRIVPLGSIAQTDDTIVPVDKGFAIVIEGRIDKGDYEKVLDIARKLCPKVSEIFLASPGGNLSEAIKIGHLVRELRLKATAPTDFGPTFKGSDPVLESMMKDVEFKIYGIRDRKNFVCASSCFFVYAGGIFRAGEIVGIHRPYLSDEDYARMGGNEAIDKSKSVGSLVKNYLKEMGIASRISESMFAIQKDSVRWLTREEIRELNGFIPELDDWINSKCGVETEIEKAARKGLPHTPSLNWTPQERKLDRELRQKDLDRVNCRDDLLQQMRSEALEKFENNRRN